MENFSYKCVKPISESNVNNGVTNFPQVVEELDRELQALLPNEASTVTSDNADTRREAATVDNEVAKKGENGEHGAFEKEKREEQENKMIDE